MNVTKYRKWYLSENWGHNRFRMMEYYVDFFENHPKVLSGQGYWLTLEKMCIGYEMDSNPEIYRPIFSHKRQRLLNNIHLNIINPYIFWNNIKLKYFMLLVKMYSKCIPIDCIKNIIMFIVN